LLSTYIICRTRWQCCTQGGCKRSYHLAGQASGSGLELAVSSSVIPHASL